MAISFRTSSTNVQSSGTSNACPVPSVQNGDVLIAVVSWAGTGATISGPSGWLQLGSTVNSPAGAIQSSLWIKSALSESGTWTWTSTVGGQNSVSVVAYSGRQLGVAQYSIGGYDSSSPTILTNSVLPERTGQLCVGLLAGRDDTATSWTTDGTERVDTSTSVVGSFYMLNTAADSATSVGVAKSISFTSSDTLPQGGNKFSILLEEGYAVRFLSSIAPMESFTTQAFAATFVPDISTSNIVKTTLTGNITTLSAPTGKAYGTFTLVFVQDATGGRTVAWNTTDYPDFADGSWQPASAPNAVSSISFYRDTNSSKWRPLTSFGGDLWSHGGAYGKALYANITSNGSAVSTTETVWVTSPTFTFKAGRAYRVSVRCLTQTSATDTSARVRVRKTNTSGDVYAETFRVNMGATGTNYPVYYETICANATGADVSAQLVGTIIRDAGTGTVTVAATSTHTAYIMAQDVGPASDFSGAREIA